MSQKRAILIIMDGWGLGKVASSDAIQHANAPFTKSLYSKYPNTTLVTCGEAVGLPDGQMGNSEVGHLNLGAGRIVYQELQRINVAIRNGTFTQNKHLLDSIRHAKAAGKPLHLHEIITALGRTADADTKAKIAGLLGWYTSKGKVFTKTAPNTYGLVEVASIPADFGEEPPPAEEVDPAKIDF